MSQSESSKSKIFFVGGLLGLLSGLLAAYLFLQRSEQNEKNPSISPGDGVKVGLGVLGVLKLISDLGERS
jgi:hypothetical protein